MANLCRPQIKACATRVTRLEPNGVPDPGANNMYVSDSLVSFAWTNNVTEGEEIEIPSACGNPISFKDEDIAKRVDVTMQINRPDPQFMELLAGGTVLTNGAAVGLGAPRLNVADTRYGVSIELWAWNITTGGTIDPTFPYNWWVWPKVMLSYDSATFENGPYLPTLKGFATENSNFFDGPLNDWDVASDRVWQFLPTTSIPATGCGYITVVAS